MAGRTWGPLEEPFTDELALVAALACGDDSALRALIDTYGPLVYAKALHIVGVPQLAEEVSQDTLLIMWWSPHRFDPSKGKLSSFLLSIARNKAIDLVRREEATHQREATFVDSPSPALVIESFEVEDMMLLRSAISKLSPTKREVIFLTYYMKV